MNENLTWQTSAAMNMSIPHNKYTSAHVQFRETATEQEASVAVFYPVCN